MAIDPTAVQGVTSGTITLPANTPSNLYSLISAQLSNACPASATEVQIYADAAQDPAHTLKIGTLNLTGDVSDANFGVELVATASRLYRSSDPGNKIPIGRIRLFASVQSSVHVEVIL